ncbi:DHH family phosphoesterase [Bacillus phage YungSlug]|nr:DHH family phosphoesterase [Bacillus phage YungSlug]
MQKEVKHFTHIDLDAVGCALVGYYAFGDTMDVEYCGYNNIDEKLWDFIQDGEIDNYNLVLITDITPKDKNLIKEINENYADKFLLLDHHDNEDAKAFNNYSWGYVNEFEEVIENKINNKCGYVKRIYHREAEKIDRLIERIENSEGLVDEDYIDELLIKRGEYPTKLQRLSCGTTILYNYLKDKGMFDRYDEGTKAEIHELVEIVRMFDTWDWTRISKGIGHVAYQLDLLLSTIGRYKFVKRFRENPQMIFNQTEQAILEIEQKRIDRLLKDKQENLYETTLTVSEGEEWKDYKVGVVFAESYLSLIGNELAKANTHLDFIVMITPSGKLSFRCREDSTIHLGREIAPHFNGGGHPKASGGSIDKDTFERILLLAISTDL